MLSIVNHGMREAAQLMAQDVVPKARTRIRCGVAGDASRVGCIQPLRPCGDHLGRAAQGIDLTGKPGPKPPLPSSAQGSGVVVNLGVGAALAPAYEGLRTLRVSPLPYIDISGLLDDRVSIADAHGVAVNIIDLGNLKAGVSVNYSGGRNRHNSDRTNGLSEISSLPWSRAF